MYFPWDCVAIDKSLTPFSKAIQELGAEKDPEVLFRAASFIESKKFMKQSYSGKFDNINRIALGLKEPLAALGFDTYKTARVEACDYAMMDLNACLWERDKQIYQIDADFAEELLALNDRSSEIAIPVSVIKDLPYKSFYLDFSECKSSKLHPFVGAFVIITWNEGECIPTFSFISVQIKENPKDELDKSIMYREVITSDLWHEVSPFAISIMGEETIIHLRPEYLPEDACINTLCLDRREGFQMYPRDYFMFLLQVILYLASDKPDIVVTSKPHAARSASTPRVAKKPSITSVGVSYGASVRSFKKHYVRGSEGSTTSTTSVGRKRPVAHMRRAHWHLFWTGPGRKVPKVRWVSAFQAGGHAESKSAVVHVVKR